MEITVHSLRAAAAPKAAPSKKALVPTIRCLTEEDLPAVATLFARVYPDHGWQSQAACAAYIREVLFNNPWRDPELPSWVAEEDGAIIGFQAILPRPMLLNDRPIKVAVSCQFMVDPERRNSLAAVLLMKKSFAGPQDLTLADGANEPARRFWAGIGGQAAMLYSMHWTRPLRPVRFALAWLARRNALSASIVSPALPVAAFADRFLAGLRSNRFHRDSGERDDEPLSPNAILPYLEECMSGNVLKPRYDSVSLAWLFEQSARKARHGAWRARIVRDAQGTLLGWYMYYARRGALSEVVQVAARGGAYGKVLQRLFIDAWREGAIALHGRLDPHYLQQLSDRNCWFRRDGTWTLFHSRHPQVTAAIHQGSAFLSRLDGEWWMRFVGG
jgi:hypothetical protein